MPKSGRAPSRSWRQNATKCCSGCLSCAAARRKRVGRTDRMPKSADVPALSGGEKASANMSEPLVISQQQDSSSLPKDHETRRPHIVIIGGGFAGIAAVKALRHCEADVTVIDRRNHHIFQPLLYQVATAVLAPADVA